MTRPALEDIPYYRYDDYCLWKGCWELISGLPYAMSPAPLIEHQKISQRIAAQLDRLLADCESCYALLPVDWKINEDTVVQPDNLVICDEPENEAYLSKAPILIFEVLSKSSAHKDRTTKFRLYESEGVQHYVMVDPIDRIAKVFSLKDGRYIKVKDVSHEILIFDLRGNCQIAIDFSKIWPDI